MDRIVIVGAGFGGFHAARQLRGAVGAAAEIVMVSSTNYFLYLPLLPQVAGGVLDPRRVAVPVSRRLPGVRLVPGEVYAVDLAKQQVAYRTVEGERGSVEYDRLLLAVGGVHKLLPVPGATEHAHGFRSLPEAMYLRDHVIRQLELAAATDDPAERAARSTFVVVGAGYTGTEVAAHLQLLTKLVARQLPGLVGTPRRWLLLDIASRVLPELDPRLSKTAAKVLRRRGVEVQLETSVEKAGAGGVTLSHGEHVATRTVVWCVGVRPDPLVDALGLATSHGRLVVDEFLQVPGQPGVFACGDAAAVPVPGKPDEVAPMTAQHAVRQGKAVARNLAASLGHGTPRPYRHRDLGFVVDLGGVQAATNPLGMSLGGPLAAALTHGYHLATIPANRLRIATEWLLEALLPRQTVQLGLVRGHEVPLDTASPELVGEATDEKAG